MKRRIKQYILRLLPFVWILFIWGNSLQTASQSSAHSMNVLEILTPLVQLLPDILIANAHYIIRKMAHAFEFFMLGILGCISLSTFNLQSKKKIVMTAIVSVSVAVIDESIQLFIPGRSGQLTDVILDSCSALLAIGIICGIKCIKQRK